ncbi:integrase catalytic domain-containing protein [Trichonephila clavipes]|nr:integrase catalytic domain-containing protein [Trichonephila clavipes]
MIYWKVSSWHSRVLAVRKKSLLNFWSLWLNPAYRRIVLRAWERSRSVEDSSPQDSARSLDKLLCFLRNEVQSEEMIMLARTGLGASRVSHPRSHPDEAD